MLKKIKILLFTLGLLLFLVTTASLLVVNFNFGIIVLLGISCVFILYGVFLEKLIKVKWLTYGILGVCTSLAILMLAIGLYGKADNATFKEDVVIVLGAGIRGERVSKLLSYRLDKAAEYSSKNPEAIIVVSGGQGPQENITEALAMERYLVAKGVPQEKILKEEAATSTYENLLFSKEILDEAIQKPYKTVIITNDFHIYRAVNIAKKLGLDVTHYNAKTEWYGVPLNYSRECVAIFKLLIVGK